MLSNIKFCFYAPVPMAWRVMLIFAFVYQSLFVINFALNETHFYCHEERYGYKINTFCKLVGEFFITFFGTHILQNTWEGIELDGNHFTFYHRKHVLEVNESTMKKRNVHLAFSVPMFVMQSYLAFSTGSMPFLCLLAPCLNWIIIVIELCKSRRLGEFHLKFLMLMLTSSWYVYLMYKFMKFEDKRPDYIKKIFPDTSVKRVWWKVFTMLLWVLGTIFSLLISCGLGYLIAFYCFFVDKRDEEAEFRRSSLVKSSEIEEPLLK